MTALVLQDVEVDGARVDVVVEGGQVTAVGPSVEVSPGAEVLDGRGGALLPGLWDHHIHLAALAAARRSVEAGPPAVVDVDGLRRALATARPGDDGWVRAVGYHESVAGPLDRWLLDELVADVPVRVQHRSGALWVVNGAGAERLGLDHAPPTGAEGDADSRPNGRLLGADRWLRERLGSRDGRFPDLADVGRELARYGVTGVTDATPYEQSDDLAALADAVTALPQRVVAMGGPPLTDESFPGGLGRGPVKLLLADHSLPALDDLVAWITRAHTAGRPIATHCVTRSALVLALAALDEAGAAPGDRIEHGAVIPPELREPLARHGLTVVTQPNFVAERGEQYWTDVDPDDRPHLYPCRSLLEADIPVAGSTDAPFGHPDPWRAIAAAVDRRTTAGTALGPGEGVDPTRALALFLGEPHDPGGPARTVHPGAPADLCLLDAPRADVLRAPSADRVRATVIDGALVG